MSTRPFLVSIVIPAHNHLAMTSNCIEKTLATCPGRRDVEIIVVDDASPEPLASLSALDDRVQVVRTETNLGFAGACNLGAAQTRGHFLIFLNNDTEPQVGWLDAMTGCAMSDERIGIVGARLLYPTGTTQHAGVIFSQADGLPRHVYRGFPGDHPAVTHARDFQAVTAACMLIRRELFFDLDGFSTEYRNEFEDIDLCLRATRTDHRITYCPAAVVTHLEAVSRKRDDAPVATDRTSTNRETFLQRWQSSLVPDEFTVYAEDGLLTASASDLYPLTFAIEPILGAFEAVDETEAHELLRCQAQQISDLTSERNNLKSDNVELQRDNVELQRIHADLVSTRAWYLLEQCRRLRSMFSLRRNI